jgi:hypothetical protein
MLKRVAPVVVAFCVLFGMAYFTHSSPKQPQTGEPTDKFQQPNNRPVEFVGVVEVVKESENELQMITSAGGGEIVGYSNADTDVEVAPGRLIRVSGNQDASSRVVDATEMTSVDDVDFYRVGPMEGSTVTSPLIVSGFVKTSIDELYWRISNKEGTEQATGIVPLKTTDAEGYQPTRFEVFLPDFDSEDFRLNVASSRSFDAEPIQLTLLNQDKTSFQVYFANYAGRGCDAVQSRERTVAQTAARGKAALLELLAGPTNEEFANGVRSALPNNVVLKKLVINNGEAQVRLAGFTPEVFSVCQTTRMRRQIEETLLQFDAIGNVNIYVNDELLG